jgi:hypothetical protein
MRRSAEAQTFLEPPLRAAALRWSVGFEWRVLQRGAAAARKEPGSGGFFLFKFKKKNIFKLLNHFLLCTFIPLQRLCFLALQRSAAAVKRSAAAPKGCSASTPAALKRAALQQNLQRCTFKTVPIPGVSEVTFG